MKNPQVQLSIRKPSRRKRNGASASEPLDLLMRLLEIPGTSGDERQVAGFVSDRLTEAGLPESILKIDSTHRRTPILGNTGNLILKLPGTMRAPRRLLMAHMDTVPICVGTEPKRHANQIVSANSKTGLGADDRAGVAAILSTALHILRHEVPHPPLTFVWTIQEEIGLHGARLLSIGSLGAPKLAFNWDGGSADRLTIGATGGYRMQIDIRGKASHAGGAPEKGISAIAIAGIAIADLQQNGWHGKIQKDGQSGTSNVGVIEGGAATNVVTDHVQIKAEARSHDSDFRRRIVDAIKEAFLNAVGGVKNVDGEMGEVTFEGRLDYESFCLNKNEPCVQAAVAAVTSIQREPELFVSNGGLDANWLSARGIPTVTLGCGQLNQHMTSEALDIAEFQDACRIAVLLATATEASPNGMG